MRKHGWFFLDLSTFLRYNKRVTFKEVRKTLETSFVRSCEKKLGTWVPYTSCKQYVYFWWNAVYDESRTHGVDRGKSRRWFAKRLPIGIVSSQTRRFQRWRAVRQVRMRTCRGCHSRDVSASGFIPSISRSIIWLGCRCSGCRLRIKILPRTWEKIFIMRIWFPVKVGRSIISRANMREILRISSWGL